ncbi:box A-binding factor-like [Lucilia cuprina]|uniref:box A-binding factor-like n=1 Tax=Lucilia cuprina TaxID=7375 RepID=UPI001F063CCF|nr:box A-binding factor-like [Lucilia cuprina]
MPQAIRNGRRASMYVEPNHLRRLNSNLSLHAIYAPTATRAGLQKSLYDLDTSGNEFGYITTQHHQQPHYTLRDSTYGGSQQRLHHDYHHNQNQAMYQSRTLPRAFLKRSADSQDSMASAGLNASATQLHNMYSASQQRLTTLMMQHQQQLQQQNRYLSMSREQELYNSRYGLHKSNEELNRHYIQQQQPIYIQPHQLQQYQQQQQQQQHANVSSTNYSTASTLKQPSLVQWPAAIPSSPSNFSGSFHMYGPATNSATQNTTNNHALLTRSNSSSGAGGMTTTGNLITAGGQQVVLNGSSTGSQGPPKFQRGYAFDEQRRPSAVLADAFDLDEIERERRRSHASLFSGIGVNANTVNSNGGLTIGGGGGNTIKNQDHYDMINGTAV